MTSQKQMPETRSFCVFKLSAWSNHSGVVSMYMTIIGDWSDRFNCPVIEFV